ncbi:hypothetical protein ACHAWU_005258 [Discostella pseudostelligera]|uniref:Uncharacterized protein n=1 Tax=Discostella pseudostelligera TaxID=259834 RepID=A0ABD3M4X1_9STRA
MGALSIVNAIAISTVGITAATECYPTFHSGKSYMNGEWASASARTVTPIFVYNFQCTSDDDMCSNDDYAPGSINSDLAWTRDSTPCSVNQTDDNILQTDESSSVSDSISRTPNLQATTPTHQPPITQPTNVGLVTAGLTTFEPTSYPTYYGDDDDAYMPSRKPTMKPQYATNPQPHPGVVVSMKPQYAPNPQPHPGGAGVVVSIKPQYAPNHQPHPGGAGGAGVVVLGGGQPHRHHGQPQPHAGQPQLHHRPHSRPHTPTNQCQCPCSDLRSKSSKHAKKSNDWWPSTERDQNQNLCPCPCEAVVVPPPSCYRCRTHIGQMYRD